MAATSRLEKFIIGSNHTFTSCEFTLKYRFLLIGYFLFSTSVAVFSASIVRMLTGSYFVGAVDFIASSITFFMFLHLRKHKSSFDIISTVAINFMFLFFTMILIGVKDEPTKLAWFGLLIVASFLLKGYKFGIRLSAMAVTVLVTLHLYPAIDLHVGNSDVILSALSYITLAIFMNFSEKEQEKNIKNIKERNEEIAKQQQLLYMQSRIIPLTKLPNKMVLQEDIQQTKGDISCMLLEISQYAMLNNEFGEKFMDKIFIKISKVLKRFEKENITLYHIDGNKFAFLIKNPTPEQDVLLAQEINHTFDNLELKDREIEVSINFLIAIVREKKWTLAHANMTLYEMKNTHKSNYEVYQYDPKKEELQKNNMYWAKRLGELMSDDKLVVYYQPIIDNKTEKVVKYECLVRAIDRDKVVSPFFFLSVAKSKGILKNITKIVIDKSFKTFSHNNFDFSINITEQDLVDNYLVDYLSLKAKEYNINPNRVFLEVLENINYQDSHNSTVQFEKLRALGFRLAIDDFGAEASNLSRLLTFKADIIKIDGQFVKNLESDEDSMLIVETVVSLAKKMGVKTVAEFVHNQEVYEIVKSLGVDFSQGFYFSPPLPQVAESKISLQELTF